MKKSNQIIFINQFHSKLTDAYNSSLIIRKTFSQIIKILNLIGINMGGICFTQQKLPQVSYHYNKPIVQIPVKDKLFVLTAFFMPVYSQTRIHLYKKFQNHMREFQNVQLLTIQCIFSDQQNYFVTSPAIKNHFQVKTKSKIWIKQNLLNILLTKLPQQARYIAWIDADIVFLNKNWSYDAIKKLKTIDIIQLFFDSDFLGANGQPQSYAKCLMYYALNFFDKIEQFNKYQFSYPHPGFAWAMNSNYLKQIKKFFQYNIVGSGDKLIAYSILGKWKYGLQKQFKMTDQFLKECEQWGINSIPKNGYGYINGRIIHNYHGQKKNRQYVSRWKLLQIHNFNPKQDLFYNEYGVINIKQSKIQLQNAIHEYFIARKDQDPNLLIKQHKMNKIKIFKNLKKQQEQNRDISMSSNSKIHNQIKLNNSNQYQGENNNNLYKKQTQQNITFTDKDINFKKINE